MSRGQYDARREDDAGAKPGSPDAAIENHHHVIGKCIVTYRPTDERRRRPSRQKECRRCGQAANQASSPFVRCHGQG